MASSEFQARVGHHAAAEHRFQTVVLAVLAALAIAVPTLIAFNFPPSATFFNQAAAFVGWGGFLLVLGTSIPRDTWPRATGSTALLAAMALLLVLSLSAAIWRSVPWSIALSGAGTIASAILAIAVGAAAARSGLGDKAFTAVCIALVVAGVACSAIGLVQVFEPEWPDGNWIASSAIPGRATGNLRQPNHLSSILLWSVVAVVWLGERRVVHHVVAVVLALLFVWGVELAGSRTGMIGMATLCLWGVLDRRLSQRGRQVLIAAPIAYALLWWITTSLHSASQAIGAGARVGGGLFESNNRLLIVSNALKLVAMHPWRGVGFGEFNFAWTLTPFPGRPNEFFDHAHNLVVQFAAELGLPFAALILALIGYAAWQALRNALADGRASAPTSPLRGAARDDDDAQPSGAMQRAAFVIVLMAGMHSMLEYPLWYAYFLLPTAFVFGLCLERPEADPRPDAVAAPNVTRPFVLASLMLMLGGTLAVYDYMRVVVIFAPPAGAGPLEQRIADGRKSVFFSHHADYAEATTDGGPDGSMSVFAGAPHYLLDSRLMIAWAKALDAHGETDKARYIAARLKEFHNPSADEFFAPCGTAEAPSKVAAADAPVEPPFQCRAPRKAYRYEDFL